MAEDIRIWQILAEDRLQPIPKSKLNLEERIEKWLAEDISVLSDDLLLIGRQVDTDFGGCIDLLCLNSEGDVVVVELKRDRTPRDITAQALDYASWVKDLSNERITELASRNLGTAGPLESAFKRAFDADLPEALNESHEMVIVASQVDDSTERIIRYLSETYGVAINAATFNYFRDQAENEFLARAFLMEPSQVEYDARTKASSKRKPNLTYEQLEELADQNGVGSLYRPLVEGLAAFFDARGTTRSSSAFTGLLGGRRRTILNILPGDSDAAKGLRFIYHANRLSEYVGATEQRLIDICPPGTEPYEAWKGADCRAGYFTNARQIEEFLTKLAELRQG